MTGTFHFPGLPALEFDRQPVTPFRDRLILPTPHDDIEILDGRIRLLRFESTLPETNYHGRPVTEIEKLAAGKLKRAEISWVFEPYEFAPPKGYNIRELAFRPDFRLDLRFNGKKGILEMKGAPFLCRGWLKKFYAYSDAYSEGYTFVLASNITRREFNTIVEQADLPRPQFEFWPLSDPVKLTKWEREELKPEPAAACYSSQEMTTLMYRILDLRRRADTTVGIA